MKVCWRLSLYLVLALVSGCTMQQSFEALPDTALTAPPPGPPADPAHLEFADGNVLNYNVQSIRSFTDRIITLKNTGGQPATRLRANGVAGAFSFKGGSFPGQGGDCPLSLTGQVTKTCKIALSYNPTKLGQDQGQLSLLYWDGKQDRGLALDLVGSSTNAPTLTISEGPGAFNFGQKTVGQSGEKTFVVQYAGAWAAEGVAAPALEAPFSYKGGAFPGTGGTCTTTITADCTIVVVFLPSAVGAAAATIRLNYNNGAFASLATRPLTGTGVAAVVPATLAIAAEAGNGDFGKVIVGSSLDKAFKVTPSGTLAAKTVTAAAFANAAFTFKGGAYPGTGGDCAAMISAPCRLVLTFSPTVSGALSDQIKLNYDDGTGAAKTATAAISGTGVIAAQLTIVGSPATIPYDFPDVSKNYQADVTFTVSNAAGAANATTIASVAFTTTVFTYKTGAFPGGGTCGQTLAGGSNCTIILRFKPTAVTAYSDTIKLSYNNGAAAATAMLAIRGNGSASPLLFVNPTSKAFGAVTVTSSTTQSFAVTYYGEAAATNVTYTGLDAPFTVDSDTCGNMITADCNFKITFAPTAVTSYSDTLSIAYTDSANALPRTPLSVTVTGSGAAPLSLSATSFDFGTRLVGSTTTQSFTLTLRTGATGVTNLSFSALSGAYSLNAGTCASSITSSCTFSVSFTPALAQLYSASTTISYRDSAGNSMPNLTLSLSGTGANAAVLTLSDGPLYDFGSKATGSSTAKTFTVTHTGFTASSVTYTGLSAPFSITGGTCGATISAASCTIIVTFAPASAGTFSPQTLLVKYNDGNTNQQTSGQVTGTGFNTGALAIFDGASNSFGKVAVGGTATRTFNVRNTGTAAVSALGTVAPPLAAPFSYAGNAYPGTGGNCATTLAAGATCQLVLAFAPTRAGVYSDTIRLTFDDGRGAQTASQAITGTGTVPVQIASSGQHTCVITEISQVKCWGHNNYGQLGYGDTNDRGDQGGEMGASLPAVNLGAGRLAKGIATGFFHTCAILDDDTLKCWGRNVDGQLGYGDTVDRGVTAGQMAANLAAVDLGPGRKARSLALGYGHSCAILDNDQLKCWGSNYVGQLGYGDTNDRGDGPGEMGANLAAVSLGTGRVARQTTANAGHTCALLDNGAIKCWGDGFYGQLGLGDFVPHGNAANQMGDNLVVVNLGSGKTAKAVSAGGGFTCAILNDDSVKCWGQNQNDSQQNSGSLGTCWTLDRDGNSGRCWDPAFPLPTRGYGIAPNQMGDRLPAVDLGPGRTAKKIRTGNFHACAWLDDGSTKCWGDNAYGELGLGDLANRGVLENQMGSFLPTLSLGTGRTVIDLVTGASHSCALLDTQAVKCWGDNRFGQLGAGNTSNKGGAAGDMGDALPFTGF